MSIARANCRFEFEKRGWSLGYIATVDRDARTIWIADAHRGDEKRFVERAYEKLAAFVELERAIRSSNGHDCAAVPV